MTVTVETGTWSAVTITRDGKDAAWLSLDTKAHNPDQELFCRELNRFMKEGEE
jgi:hypothetical protein